MRSSYNRLMLQVKRLLKSGSFYGEVYRKAGISGVNSQEDFEKLPFSSKDDLRNAYPLGIQAVPEEEVVRIHSSSGTTGKPVIIPYTAKDVDDWAIMFAVVTKQRELRIRTGSRLLRPTACGLQVSAFSSAQRSLVQ